MPIEKLNTARKAVNVFTQQGRNINSLAKYDRATPIGFAIETDAYTKKLDDGSVMLKMYDAAVGKKTANRTYIVHKDGSYDFVIPKEKAMQDDNGRTLTKNRLMHHFPNGAQGRELVNNPRYDLFPPCSIFEAIGDLMK